MGEIPVGVAPLNRGIITQLFGELSFTTLTIVVANAVEVGGVAEVAVAGAAVALLRYR